MRKNKLISAILIIVCLFLVTIITTCIIQYVALEKETEHVELPEIVFEYAVDNPWAVDRLRIIDRDGNVYNVPLDMEMTEMVELYRDGTIRELERIRKVNVVILKKKYLIFMELMNNPEYNPQYPPGAPAPDIDSKERKWYGYYYDDNNNLCRDLLYQYKCYDPEVSDKRGQKLAEWIEKNVRDD